MSDVSTNKFNAQGDNAARAAFTPSPGTPTPTPAQGYTFWDTDDQVLYAWETGTGWVATSGSGGNVNAGGTLTQYAVVLGDGSTDVAVVSGLGSSGDVLTSNGAGVAPTFQAPTGGGGGLVLLEQHTASASASLDFTTAISSTYDDYLIEFVNIVPASNTVDLSLRMSTNGGSSYDSGANYSRTYFAQSGVTFSGIGTTGQTSILIANSINNTANWSFNGSWRLFNPGGSIYKIVDGKGWGLAAAARYQFSGGGAYEVTTAVDAFQFFFSSGNIASGTIRVYGLEK